MGELNFIQMKFKKEAIVAILGVLFLVIFLNLNMSGKSVGLIYNNLGENEYLFYVNEPQWINEKLVELIDVSESKDVRISIRDEIRSISDAIIVSNGLQIEKISAVADAKRPFAVLKIIVVEQDRNFKCKESDNGEDIYLKGRCFDDYYEMGVDDYCSENYLREFFCEYDHYIHEVHCMRAIVKCSYKCENGECK